MTQTAAGGSQTRASTRPKGRVDRAAAVRRALRTLVAEHGFHGASMSDVAKEAGVASGTAYVHYASKDELVFAAYLEVKRELGLAAVAQIDHTARFHERFVQIWFGIYRHLAGEPERARFLVQIDSSPYAGAAHDMAMRVDGDPIMAEAARPDAVAALAPLPLEVLYDLGLAPAIRLATGMFDGSGALDDELLGSIAEACWRAVTRA
jgi:AcrR family transcriptional regulator